MSAATNILADLGACPPALDWVAGRPLTRELWDECPSGSWMLWLLPRIGVDRRLVTLAACACARLALPYAAPGDARPRVAIETAERWARGEVAFEERQAASKASWLASKQADASDAEAWAAEAASWAWSRVAAWRVAAWRVEASASASPQPNFDRARAEALARCANAVRGVVPWEVVELALSAYAGGSDG